MSNLLKKLALSFLSALILFASCASFFPAKAASPAPSSAPTWYNSPFNDWYGKVYDPKNPGDIFGERYTAAQVQWVIYGIWGFLINTTTGPQNAGIVQCFLNNATNIDSCASELSKLVERTNASNLALKKTPQNQNLWSLVFTSNRGLSGISYVEERVQKFALIPEVHAAPVVGFGFGALTPIQSMWRAFRDLAFGLFVIVAVVFAFMIMFRVKLSPQTVISVQSALPKIVIALILVTFSYAIAGFLIDIMYVVIGLVSLVGASIYNTTLGINSQPSQLFNLMTVGQPLGLNLQAGVFGLIIIYFVAFFLPLLILLALAGSPILLIPGAGPILYFIFMALLFVAGVLIALWTGVKVVWALLKAFVNVILLTVFAPIQIALGVIVPSLGFGQWLRSYISSLAVFVVTGTLFLFSFIFLIEGIATAFQGSVAAALLDAILGTSIHYSPFGSGAWPPLLGTGNAQWIGLLFLGVSFVLFTLTPKANEIIQGLLSGKPFAYGTAIGEAVVPAGWLAGQAYNQTGARDMVEMLQALRKGRTMEGLFGQGRPLRPVVEALGGGGIEVNKMAEGRVKRVEEGRS